MSIGQIYLVIATSIVLNFIWKLFLYEFRQHFGKDYIVTVMYSIYGEEFKMKYAIRAFSDNTAYKIAFTKFTSMRNLVDIKKITVSEAD